MAHKERYKDQMDWYIQIPFQNFFMPFIKRAFINLPITMFYYKC